MEEKGGMDFEDGVGRMCGVTNGHRLQWEGMCWYRVREKTPMMQNSFQRA